VLRVEAKVEGYISLGFMDASLIGKADVTTVWMDEQSGQPRAIDQFLSGYVAGTHGELANDPLQNNVQVLGGTVKEFESNNDQGHVKGVYTSVTLKRNFSAAEDAASGNDQEIVKQQQTGILWFTSKTAKPLVDANTGVVTVPTNGYKYPNGNKGTWKVTFDNSNDTLTCEYYCELQMNVCGDTQEKERQFSSPSECLARCIKYTEDQGTGGAWPLGNIQQDHNTNSLACRINAAHQAENAPDESEGLRQELCDNSGVTGNGVCGDYCENYCAHAKPRQCDFAQSWSANTQECLDTCNGGFNSNNNTAVQGVVTDVRYNSANFPFYDTAACRTLHASLAYDDFVKSESMSLPPWLKYGSTYRCPLADPLSAVCSNASVPTCNYYCESVMASCTGSRAQFQDYGSCTKWCSSNLESEKAILTAGGHTDYGDSHTYNLGCLTWIAQHATSDLLCESAVDGGSICPAPDAFQEPNKGNKGNKGTNAVCEKDSYSCKASKNEYLMQETCECVEPIQVTIRYDMAYEAFVKEDWKKSMAQNLGVTEDRIQVKDVRPGSVVVDFVVLPPSGHSTMPQDQYEVIKRALVNPLQSYPSAKVENFYHSNYTTVEKAEEEKPGYDTSGSSSNDDSTMMPLIIGLSVAGVVIVGLAFTLFRYRKKFKKIETFAPKKFVDLSSSV
jgi:hypothetical protein